MSPASHDPASTSVFVNKNLIKNPPFCSVTLEKTLWKNPKNSVLYLVWCAFKNVLVANLNNYKFSSFYCFHMIKLSMLYYKIKIKVVGQWKIQKCSWNVHKVQCTFFILHYDAFGWIFSASKCEYLCLNMQKINKLSQVFSLL